MGDSRQKERNARHESEPLQTLRGSSVAVVGALRIFRVQTFFKNERDSRKNRTNSDRLENGIEKIGKNAVWLVVCRVFYFLEKVLYLIKGEFMSNNKTVKPQQNKVDVRWEIVITDN